VGGTAEETRGGVHALEPETLAALTKRGSWPSGMRRYVASLYDTRPENWEHVVAFIEAHSRRDRSDPGPTRI
jgi:hypothetical protein